MGVAKQDSSQEVVEAYCVPLSKKKGSICLGWEVLPIVHTSVT